MAEKKRKKGKAAPMKYESSIAPNLRDQMSREEYLANRREAKQPKKSASNTAEKEN